MAYQLENLRICLILKVNLPYNIPLVKTELKGKNSIRYFRAVIRNDIPLSIKTASSLNNAFKNRIKSWKPNCSCRLCKTYLQGVGFVNIRE